jgi:hypothetical protein
MFHEVQRVNNSAAAFFIAMPERSLHFESDAIGSAANNEVSALKAVSLRTILLVTGQGLKEVYFSAHSLCACIVTCVLSCM